MKTRLVKFLSLALACVLLGAALCGCDTVKADDGANGEPAPKTEEWMKVDPALLLADPADYASAEKHNTPIFQFRDPDTITVVRNNGIVGTYSKGDATYAQLLALMKETLEGNIADYRAENPDGGEAPYPHSTLGIMGFPVQTEEGVRSALLGGTYVVYNYGGKTCAPVYFAIRTEAEGLSELKAAQPDDQIFGFYAYPALTDYLGSLK